jgi:hypothetical protein
MAVTVTISESGRQWDIRVNDVVVEGGFFKRANAVAWARKEYGYNGV